MIVAVNAALIAAIVRFRDATRLASRAASRPPAGRCGRSSARSRPLALAIFVFGVVATTNVREVEPTGSNGLGTARRPPRSASGACRSWRRSRGRSRPWAGAVTRAGADRGGAAGDRRDRPAMAVALRVPGRAARAADLLLRRAGRPRGHGRRPQHHLDRRPAHLVGAGAGRAGAGVAGQRHRDLVQGRPRGPLRGPLDGLLGHRVPRDALLGAGGQRPRVPRLRRAPGDRALRRPGAWSWRDRPGDAADDRRPARGRDPGAALSAPTLDRARDERRPQVGRADVHRDRPLLPGDRGDRVRADADPADRARQPR